MSGPTTPSTAPELSLEPNETPKRKLSEESSEAASGGSESGEISSQPQKRQRTSRSKGDQSASVEPSGDTAHSAMNADVPADGAASSRNAQKKNRGWNQSTAGTVRTSFSSFSSTLKKAPPKNAPQVEAQAPAPTDTGAAKNAAEGLPGSKGPTEDDDTTKEASGASSDDAGARMTFKSGSRTWVLPPTKTWEGSPNDKNTNAWRNNFGRWCKALIDLNESWPFVAADYNFMVEAYSRWLKGTDIPKKLRKFANTVAVSNAKQINILVQKAEERSGGKPPSRPVAPAQQQQPEETVADEPTGLNSKSLGTVRESAAYLQRYFPGISEDDEFCVLCSLEGHRRDACPSMTCIFCRTQGEHTTYRCPMRVRCTGCKQIGHAKSECREKLALAAGEALECAFCGEHDHTEAVCVAFRRSFYPTAYNLKKVQNLPIYCYSCGATGHYGTECGLSRPPSKPFAHEIWNKENSQRYVDPSSSDVAIALDAAPVVSKNGISVVDGRPDFGGKSLARPTHVVFEGEDDDDDDDYEPFIRAPVRKPAPPSQIRFQGASMSGPGQRGKGSRGRGGGRNQHGGGGEQARAAAPVNPPLPPGPPPGLPARPQASAYARRPVNVKPVANGDQGSSRRGRSRRGGRGGGRGGGR